MRSSWSILLSLVAIVGGAFVAEARGDEKKGSAEAAKPGEEIAGSWSLLSSNGEKDPHADDADESTLLSFNFEDGTWKLQPRSDAGGFAFDGKFTVDPKFTPHILDAVIQGDGGDTSVFAVYKVEKDMLTINLRKDGQRPADFELAPDVSTLMVFKRHAQK